MFLKSMLTDRRFWKSTLALALPIALQNLLSSSLAIIDNLMIGQLGDIAVGAIGVSAQVSQLINIFLFGLTAGGTVFAAQYWGKRDLDGIRRTYGLVVINCLVISLLASLIVGFFPELVLGLYTNSKPIIQLGSQYLKIAAFSYIGIAINLALCTILRSTESVRLPVIASLISVFCNAVLNAALIFGLWGFPRLEVRGAAIATVIASAVNPLFILLVSFFKKNILRCSLRRMFSFPKHFASHYYKVSLPVFFNEALWAMGVAGTNMVYGRMGETNIAALTVTRTIENISYVLIIGICNACAVLIGKSVGEEDTEKANCYAKRFALLVPSICFMVGMTIILLRTPILSLFELSQAARSTAMWLLLIYGIETPLRNLPYITIVGIFRPGGDTKTGMLFDMSCLWGIALPLTIVLGLVLKMDFIPVYALMLFCEDIPKTLLCVRHLLSRKWIRAVT